MIIKALDTKDLDKLRLQDILKDNEEGVIEFTLTNGYGVKKTCMIQDSENIKQILQMLKEISEE